MELQRGGPRRRVSRKNQDQDQDQGMDVGIRLIHIDPSQYEESVAAKRDEVHACREEKITRARRHGCTGPRAPCESQISVKLCILSAHPPLPHCPPLPDCCVYRGYTTVRIIVFVQRRNTDNPTDQFVTDKVKQVDWRYPGLRRRVSSLNRNLTA